MTVMPNGVSLTPNFTGASRTDAAAADNGSQLEALYQQWKADPASVDAQWNAFFAGF
jgi:2-oxoglutarate dehydrogenase complex dehydrogenase (E1) component-like enzyme